MIADAIRRAQQMHRATIEATYDGTCNWYELRPVKNPDTKVTHSEEVQVQREIPCHLSYSSAAPVVGSDTVTVVAQVIKLFLAPELVVLPGSRIEVTQHGRTESYGQSGKAAVYSSHQEIPLELWKEYA